MADNRSAPARARYQRITTMTRRWSGHRTPQWIAEQLHDPTVTAETITRVAWNIKAAPTRRPTWHTAHSAAPILGYTPQWVSWLCRLGRIEAHRNPGGRCWLISDAALQRFRHGQQVASITTPTIEGRYYVTHHAVQRFQERVLKPQGLLFSETDARRILIAALNAQDWQEHPIRHSDREAVPATTMIRVQYRVGEVSLSFRAFISAPDPTPQRPLPSIVTIV